MENVQNNFLKKKRTKKKQQTKTKSTDWEKFSFSHFVWNDFIIFSFSTSSFGPSSFVSDIVGTVCVRSVLMPLFVCFLMKKPSSFCCFALEAILIVEMNTASITDTDWMFQQQ